MVQIEIVAQSVDDAIAAERGGAHRLELCSALRLDGLTPSAGLIQTVRAVTRLPIMAMIRPRAGGFSYSMSEYATMEADVEAVLAAGADGIVLGILNPDGRVDAERCGQLQKRAAGRPVVFHRAFDVTQDLSDSLAALVDLGFTRVLSSGGRDTAREGADTLRNLIERADGRIEVMPGGGIRAANVREIVAQTGATQVHLAPLELADGEDSRFGRYERIQEREVAAVRAAL